MCGIVGYLGKGRTRQFVVSRLKKLEYRGYDSSGIAFNKDDKIDNVKAVGNIANLENLITDENEVQCAIAHTRWATHGKPSVKNCHPHSSQSGVWSIVHNGIIENYQEIKEKLKTPTDSDTDTSTVAELLEERNAKTIGDFVEVFKEVQGSYAIVAMNSNALDELFIAKNRSPLYVAENKGEYLVASDPICFVGFAKHYYSFNNYEYAHIKNGKIKFFDAYMNELKKELVELDDCFEETQKFEYEHFMLKEIMEQPEALKRQVKTYRDTNVLAKFNKEFIEKFDYISFIGCGTAYHASMVGARYIERLTGIRASAEIASEFIYKEPVFANEKTLFVFVSQSGETADTLMAMNIAKEHGATCVALTNVLYSSLAKQADYVLPVCAGPEIAVASTKAYVCQLSALYMFARHLNNQIEDKQYNYLKDIELVSSKILDFDQEKINHIADAIKDEMNPIFIGKDLDYIAACEASLKLKEVAYVNATNYPSGELKHGFLALIEDGTPIIVFATEDKVRTKTLNAAHEAVSRGAFQITITNDGGLGYDNLIVIDVDNEYLMPMLEIAPMQYLAYQVSVKKGINPDQPRNLAKSVTVE